jgi:protein-S-isoprenylcysteine O-methyltransferase Ste14
MLLRYFIIACWAAFGIYWVAAAASPRKPTAERQDWRSRIWYLLLLVLAFALLFGLVPVDPLTRRIALPTPATDILAALLCAGGLALAIWARRAIGRNWSGLVTLKRGHELVTGGPYRYVRHPIYSAILAMFLATALAIGQLGGFLGFVLCLASFWIKLKQEEALMLRQFPDDYATYRARVKALIPFVI